MSWRFWSALFVRDDALLLDFETGSKAIVSLRVYFVINPVSKRMMSIKDNSMYYPKERPVTSLKRKTYHPDTQPTPNPVHSISYLVRLPH